MYEYSPEYEPDEFEKWYFYGIEPEDKSKIAEWEQMIDKRGVK